MHLGTGFYKIKTWNSICVKWDINLEVVSFRNALAFVLFLKSQNKFSVHRRVPDSILVFADGPI